MCALDEQDVRPLDAIYVTGDNEDDTAPVLLTGTEYWWPRVHHFNTGCPAWARDGEPRYSLNDHANLAVVYNRCLDLALEGWPDATHVWMIDSDVIPDPDVLELLLAAGKPLVSAVVPLGKQAWNFMCGMEDGEPRRTGFEGRLLQAEEPMPVQFLAACTLIRRGVLEAGKDDPCFATDLRTGEGIYLPKVRFAPHPRSHDFPFCAAARAAGYGLWLEPRARCSHYMKQGEEPLR